MTIFSQQPTKCTLKRISTRLFLCILPSVVKLALIAPSKIQQKYAKKKLLHWLLISLRKLVQIGQDLKAFKRNGDSHFTSSQKVIVLLLTQELLLVIIIRALDGLLQLILVDHLQLSTLEEEPSKYHGITTMVLSPRSFSMTSMFCQRILKEQLKKVGWQQSVHSGSIPLHRLQNHQCMMSYQASGKQTLLISKPVSLQALVQLSTLSMVQLSVVNGLNKPPIALQTTRELWDISKQIFPLVRCLTAQECKHIHLTELAQFFPIGIKTGLVKSASS